MKSSQNKDKVLTLRVNHAQYEKICALADIREMNVTEYIRHTAIGNRIKPTKSSSKLKNLVKSVNCLKKTTRLSNRTIRHSSIIFIS
ncbi:plasmid mobilization protein [Escherichia coli]|uniref:plasmid mobilization protein n=1 Tax=Escherichia coli TaxID=562 RepID=UPI003C6DA162